jgi:hypothetical protein
MDTPVLFLFFTRPETAKRVFKEIRKAKPRKLFLAADGPRENVPGEDRLCAKTRHVVESLIDWDCEVKRLYREHNLGCKEAVSSAINWFFSQVEEGIILEDDTLPTQSFFQFASKMLERYRNEQKIMHVGGNNYQDGRIRGDGSYYYSRTACSWGWATWRRSWKKYDVDMAGLSDDWTGIINNHLDFPLWPEYWHIMLQKTAKNEIDTWDYQWHYAIRKNGGYCILPNLNLVSNIGVGKNATHTTKKTYTTSMKSRDLWLDKIPTQSYLCDEADVFDFKYTIPGKWPPIKNPIEWITYFRFLKNNVNSQ